jgi:hypothetical protein
MLFFEKKNQKTFAPHLSCGTCVARVAAMAGSRVQKFFASFFQKITPFVLRCTAP